MVSFLTDSYHIVGKECNVFILSDPHMSDWGWRDFWMQEVISERKTLGCSRCLNHDPMVLVYHL